jgi:hypothetical protein
VRDELKELVVKLADFEHLDDEDFADLDKFISGLPIVKSKKNQLKKGCRSAWKPGSTSSGASFSAAPPLAPLDVSALQISIEAALQAGTEEKIEEGEDEPGHVAVVAASGHGIEFSLRVLDVKESQRVCSSRLSTG